MESEFLRLTHYVCTPDLYSIVHLQEPWAEIVPRLRRNPHQLKRRMTWECRRLGPKVCRLRCIAHVCVRLCAHTELLYLIHYMCSPAQC